MKLIENKNVFIKGALTKGLKNTTIINIIKRRHIMPGLGS